MYFRSCSGSTETSHRKLPGYLRHWSEQQNICTPVSEECAVRILLGLASVPETIMYIEFSKYPALPAGIF
jgi:hypothetical protein